MRSSYLASMQSVMVSRSSRRKRRFNRFVKGLPCAICDVTASPKDSKGHNRWADR
ncbi:Mycobacterium rhizamassiliense ORFan [Mycobacterium rhizamassiliense]|jgi:hypothetical protein|uniref:Mycobacterium rhizamassiliense ORFan n=1 Tax=Mycobacterium rhizamassiliense TaxID=1841860 RepID=A0A2U3NL27_9MYCO|nr:Mycobacterium rhizamassiliense ORFan [Mycobacterium rhizamassiliense]